MKFIKSIASGLILAASFSVSAEDPINGQFGYYKLNYLTGYADRKTQELKARAIVLDHIASTVVAIRSTPQAISYDLNSLGLTAEQLSVIKKVTPEFSIADQLTLCKIDYSGFDAAIYLPEDGAQACSAIDAEKSEHMYAWKKSAAGNKVRMSNVQNYQFENTLFPYKYVAQLDDINTTDTRFRVKYTQGTLAQKQGLAFELDVECKNCKDSDASNDTHIVQQITRTGLGHENYAYSPSDIGLSGGEVYSFSRNENNKLRLEVDRFLTSSEGAGYVTQSRGISTEAGPSWEGAFIGELDEHDIYEHNFNSRYHLNGESLSYCQILELSENGSIRRYIKADGSRLGRNSNDSCGAITDPGFNETVITRLLPDTASVYVDTSTIQPSATNFLTTMNKINGSAVLGQGEKLTVAEAEKEFGVFEIKIQAGFGL